VKWAWNLGEFAGIRVQVHATFLLLIGWVALIHWRAARTLEATLAGIIFTLALFLCVVLHEYGHALTARRYGIRTKDITLLPIGGLARLERMPENPTQELWVALAGPAVNVVIAGILAIWIAVTAGWSQLDGMAVSGGSFAERLLVVNVFLVAFNLLPAFPMDGGRVLRALLARRVEYTRATQIAASIGQGMAFLFGFLGLFSNPFLVFIALFVWIGAAQEASMVQMKSAVAGIPVSRAMVTDFRVLPAGGRLSDATELILRGSQLDFPVIEAGRMVGVLTKLELLRALTERGPEAPITDVMSTDFEVVDANEMLESGFRRMQERQCHTAPVMHHGQLVGLLTMDQCWGVHADRKCHALTSQRRPRRTETAGYFGSSLSLGYRSTYGRPWRQAPHLLTSQGYEGKCRESARGLNTGPAGAFACSRA